LRRCLVQPRTVTCCNTVRKLNDGKPLQLWIVLQELPAASDGYLSVFDDEQGVFGLAHWDGDTPVFSGFTVAFSKRYKGCSQILRSTKDGKS
jgi:hypothetical protein